MTSRAGQLRVAAFVVMSLAGSGFRSVSGQRPGSPQDPDPAHVAIIGTDYAFVQLPTTLAAGPTLFSFENRGSKRHELSIALLKSGVPAESLLATAGRLASLSSRAVSDSIVGILIARPTERSGGQLYVRLIAGRTYIVVCTLRDTPDAPPHMSLGMVGSFQVR
ncbi:MAG TPA: hypothetical protein VNS10_05650 [Gemmatimonadaceae bacterium]|jgi:hypothetical protein|nr:hypothetical protein [Gemmatimonadaceae bacterium]